MLSDLTNQPPEFKTELQSTLEFTVDNWLDSFKLPEITDLEDNSPFKVTVDGLTDDMIYDEETNTILFKNNIKTPGIYSTKLKI